MSNNASEVTAEFSDGTIRADVLTLDERAGVEGLRTHRGWHSMEEPGWDDVFGLIGIIDRLARELEVARSALGKINDIRNSIVGYQAINWSAHIYPLVAALEEAGIKGDGYEKSREMARTQLERISGLESELEVARAEQDKFVNAIRAQRDRWMRASTASTVGAGQVLHDMLCDLVDGKAVAKLKGE